MLKKEGAGKAGKLEAGVAEINNSLCKAMIGLVLSEEAVRSGGLLRSVWPILFLFHLQRLPSKNTADRATI